MARTVTVRDAEGTEFRCTRLQWERIHEPAGRTLVTDENGRTVRKPARKAAENTDSGD